MSEENEPNPEDVKKFLQERAEETKSNAKNATEPTGEDIWKEDEDSIPVENIVTQEMDPAETIEDDDNDEGSQRKTVMDPTMRPDQPTQKSTFDWSINVPKIGKVTVSNHEKKLYAKSFLNDEPTLFEIPLKGLKTSITFRSKTSAENDLIFYSVAAEPEKSLIKDVPTYLTRLQQFTLSISLVQVGPKPFEAFKMDPEASMEVNALALHKFNRKHIMPMQSTRLTAITHAAAIFEAKLTACDNAIDTGDFLDPVD